MAIDSRQLTLAGGNVPEYTYRVDRTKSHVQLVARAWVSFNGFIAASLSLWPVSDHSLSRRSPVIALESIRHRLQLRRKGGKGGCVVMVPRKIAAPELGVDSAKRNETRRRRWRWRLFGSRNAPSRVVSCRSEVDCRSKGKRGETKLRKKGSRDTTRRVTLQGGSGGI